MHGECLEDVMGFNHRGSCCLLREKQQAPCPTAQSPRPQTGFNYGILTSRKTREVTLRNEWGWWGGTVGGRSWAVKTCKNGSVIRKKNILAMGHSLFTPLCMHFIFNVLIHAKTIETQLMIQGCYQMLGLEWGCGRELLVHPGRSWWGLQSYSTWC